jgi:nicotinate-nucleotide adenylyltransferase
MIKFFIYYIIWGYFLFKDRKESVALFGGSFDPPHFGHRAVVKEALEILNVDRLIIIPTFLNPFKSKSHLSPEKRLIVSERFFRDFPKVIVDSYEVERGEATPTAITLNYFQNIYSVKYIIVGADNLATIDKWYNFKWLNSQITWVIATRVGYKIDTSNLRDFKILQVEADISSTEIRKKGNRIYMDLDKRVDRIVSLLDEKKGEDIEVFDLKDVDYISESVVLATALSGKHAISLSEQLKERLKPLGEEFLHIDETEDWVVIDMGDILVHIMSSTYREKYSLEEFLTELSRRKVDEV